MRAMSIRRVNLTDFDGRPKRQEKPETAQAERLDVARLGKVSELGS